MATTTATIPMRSFGNTGLNVSAIGFGAMHFDGIEDEQEVGRLLNGVLDMGINLVDTARGYGRSEERIGRHISHRRQEYVLSTKFGYGVDGVPDWTYDCIVQGVERALRVMRTDVIDIGHLHSCPLHVLERGEVTQALADCIQAGKLRAAAYSGENAELAHALADHRFGSVQLSLSLNDRANAQQLPVPRGQGVLIKRALAGLAWMRSERPHDHCEGAYWDRWQTMRLNLQDPVFEGQSWTQIALRYAAFAPSVSSVLLGTKSLANLQNGLDSIALGPLSPTAQAHLQHAWQTAGGAHWPGIV